MSKKPLYEVRRPHERSRTPSTTMAVGSGKQC